MSAIRTIDTFAPSGSLGGPGDPWPIAIGIDPLALDAHLDQDLLLVAEPWGAGSEGNARLDLFPPSGSLPDGWSTTVTARHKLYVAATRGRSTANDDEPPARHVPGRLLLPTYSQRLFEGVDPKAAAGADFGTIRLANADGRLDGMLQQNWDSTPLTLKRGPRGAPFKAYTTVGRFRSAGLVRDLEELRLRIRTVGWQLDGPLHGETFAGTGGLEGVTRLAGKPKPWALGWCRNVAPERLTDDNSIHIFQWSLGSSQDLQRFLHGGVSLPIYQDYPNYDALHDAEDIPSGQVGTCLAQSLGRPNVTLQFDVRVDVIGDADTVNGFGAPLHRAAIARRIATHRGPNRLDEAAEIDASSFMRMAAFHSAPVGWWFDGTETKAAALARVLGGVLGWGRVRPDGRFAVGWVETPELLTPAVTFTYGRHGMGKPELVDTAPPRRGTIMAWSKNVAPQDRASLSPSLSEQSEIALLTQPARYAQVLEPAIGTLYPTAPLVTVDDTGFRDQVDAAAEAARQQRIFRVERYRWSLPMQIDPYVDLEGSAAGLAGAPHVVGQGRAMLCVGIEAPGTSVSTFGFFV